jgi:hypothetical protein
VRLRDLRVRREAGERVAAERDEQLRADDVELRLEPRQVVGDLVGLRVAVAGRARLDDVRDEDVVALRARLLEQAVEQLAGGPTNGRPDSSSFAPGASPTSMTGAVALPSPGTRFVACSQISKPHGTCSRISARSRRAASAPWPRSRRKSYPFGPGATTAEPPGPILRA